MLGREEDAERTYAWGQRTLDEIIAQHLPVTPRIFEIWYTHVSGAHTELSGALNASLADGGSVDQIQLDRIYAAYVSDSSLAVRIDRVGNHVGKEIEVVRSEVDLAARRAAIYGAKLHDGSSKFAASTSQSDSRDLMQTLLRSTVEVEARNKALQQRLKASHCRIKELQEDLESIRVESLTDALTSIGNRRLFDLSVADMVVEAHKAKARLCVLVGDIDHFKKINDRFGHAIGDQVLRHVALSLKQSARSEDIVCRYGGEEFAIILPNTILDAGIIVAERIRETIMARRLMRRATGEKLDSVTISVGVAMLQPGDTAASLCERADRCLYAAKRHGRNRVICERELDAQDG